MWRRRNVAVIAQSDARSDVAARIPRAAERRVMKDTSFFARFTRRALNPQTCWRVGPYRSDLKGTAASTVHPPSKRPVRTVQIGLKSVLFRSLVS